MSSARVVASGVDALYMSARARLDVRVLDRLENARVCAQLESAHVPVWFAGSEFWLAPHAWGRYRYCLDNEQVRLGLSPSFSVPTIRMQPRTWWLHEIGPAAATASLLEALASEAELTSVGTSRLDLYVDIQGVLLSTELAASAVTPARSRQTFSEGSAMTGLQFGRRGSQGVLARLYDKTVQLASKPDGAWWPDVWSASGQFDPSSNVIRVEFELGRKPLVELGLATPGLAILRSGPAWRWATSWLTMRDATEDTNRARWPVADWWAVVQHGYGGDHVPLERVSERRRARSLSVLMPQIAGCLVSAGALLDVDQLRPVALRTTELVDTYLASQGATFAERVAVRRREIEAR